MRFTIDRIDHIVLNVKDVEITAAWYQRVLGMEREDFGPDNRTALKFGGQKINVRPTDADQRTWPTGVNDAPGSADLCFITAAPPDEVVGHLHDCGVTILRARSNGRRAGADPLGVLPRSRRQPGRNRLLSAAVMRSSRAQSCRRRRVRLLPGLDPAGQLDDPACRHGVRAARARAWCRWRPGCWRHPAC